MNPGGRLIIGSTESLFGVTDIYERKQYLNRRALWLFIKDKQLLLNNHEICWELDLGNGLHLNVWKDTFDYSLHSDDLGCVLSGFKADLFDMYYYKKTIKKLKESIGTP